MMEVVNIEIINGLKITTYDNGVKSYRKSNGELHNLEGPAFYRSNGSCCYYINGISIFSEEEFFNIVKILKENPLLDWHDKFYWK